MEDLIVKFALFVVMSIIMIAVGQIPEIKNETKGSNTGIFFFGVLIGIFWILTGYRLVLELMEIGEKLGL